MAKSSLQSIQKDIEKRFKSAIKDMADDVAFEIEKAYETVIEEFYNDYPNPVSYERTYSTYLGSNAYDDIFGQGIQQFGDSYFAGINVSSSNIPGDPYRAYKGWVFERTFYKGIHGINKKDKDRMNKYRGKGYEKDLIRVKVIKNMSPTPKSRMDTRFKNITKKSNMDKMFSDALNKAFN